MPVNYILLFFMTAMEAFCFAAITAQLTPESVLISIAVLAGTLICLFGGALFAPSFKKLLVFMCVALALNVILQTVFMVYLFRALWITQVNYVVWGVLGACGSGVYVIIDLIMVMIPGAINNEDYIMGALMLYADIMRMFLYILMIFGKKK